MLTSQRELVKGARTTAVTIMVSLGICFVTRRADWFPILAVITSVNMVLLLSQSSTLPFRMFNAQIQNPETD